MKEKTDGRIGSVQEVFTTFLRLGLTSFGGPIAHLGYFRREFVERRGRGVAGVRARCRGVVRRRQHGGAMLF